MSKLPIILFLMTVIALVLSTNIEVIGVGGSWMAAASHIPISGVMRLVMQIVVSLAVLIAALYIILSPVYSPGDKHWAYGAAGTILGYWLKGK